MFLGDFVNCIHLSLVYVKGFADNIVEIAHTKFSPNNESKVLEGVYVKTYSQEDVEDSYTDSEEDSEFESEFESDDEFEVPALETDIDLDDFNDEH